jgi:hypothetical protein
MTELKTLKDLLIFKSRDKRIYFNPKPFSGIREIPESGEFIEKRFETVDIYELKQEAIKWVKDIEKEINLGNAKGLERTVYWIKHFFNLTGEDIQ